uniref:Uncharacterized protein n=1 Tax=Arundo donax TaxID=35708 RepID=A0A0A9G663_ARUDO
MSVRSATTAAASWRSPACRSACPASGTPWRSASSGGSTRRPRRRCPPSAPPATAPGGRGLGVRRCR